MEIFCVIERQRKCTVRNKSENCNGEVRNFDNHNTGKSQRILTFRPGNSGKNVHCSILVH